MLAPPDASVNVWLEGGGSAYLDLDLGACSRLLRQCGSEKALAQGRKIHARVAAICESADYGHRLGRDVVEMYLNCGSLMEARSAFQELCSSSNDAALWTAVVAAFSQQGQFDESWRVFHSMLQAGVPIDKVTLLTVLNACTKAEALAEGRKVRDYSEEIGLSNDVAVGTAIVNFYGKCRELDDAVLAFEKLEATRNVVTWTVLITAYVQGNRHKQAFHCLWRMQLEGILPNKFTFANALGSCNCRDDLARGKTLHGWISESGLDSNLLLANALVSMYSRCGGVEEAAKVFKGVGAGSQDVIMWTSMLAAYKDSGDFAAAFRLFQTMLLEGIVPDKVSFITILGSDFSSRPDRVNLIHDVVCECHLNADVIVGTAFIEAFSRVGNLSSACSSFDQIYQPAVVSWSALISAMVEHGFHAEALATFQRMMFEGVRADKIALITVLGACNNSRFLKVGTWKLLIPFFIG